MRGTSRRVTWAGVVDSPALHIVCTVLSGVAVLASAGMLTVYLIGGAS